MTNISKYQQLNDPDWLRQKYVMEQHTIRDIATIVGCSAFLIDGASVTESSHEPQNSGFIRQNL